MIHPSDSMAAYFFDVVPSPTSESPPSPPSKISPEHFTHDGQTLFVQLTASSQRHRRASPSELHALLCPSSLMYFHLPEPSSYWWEAQCIHYGIHPSDYKEVAKDRLRDALLNSRLYVPLSVLILEAGLRREAEEREEKAMEKRRDSLGMELREMNEGEVRSTSVSMLAQGGIGPVRQRRKRSVEEIMYY